MNSTWFSTGTSIAAFPRCSLANGERFENSVFLLLCSEECIHLNQHFLFSTETLKAIELAIPDRLGGRPSSWSQVFRSQLKDFFRSDHYYFWDADPSLPAVFLTDSANFRGYMQQCYHKGCDDMSQVTPEMMTFLGRTSANMAELATNMTNVKACQMKKTGRVNNMFYSWGFAELLWVTTILQRLC